MCTEVSQAQCNACAFPGGSDRDPLKLTALLRPGLCVAQGGAGNVWPWADGAENRPSGPAKA